MDTQWRIETRGDPIGAVRNFIGAIWEKGDLNGMMVPLNVDSIDGTRPRLINKPELLEHVNPFKPVMMVNAANLIPAFLERTPGARIGVILRPCEMRALTEMTKHGKLSMDQVITICVDCLGTLPLEDYQWRAEHKGSGERLTQEALQFARQGGILSYRYRSACQMCTAPEARGADLNLNVLGLPVRQCILIQTIDAATAERFDLVGITDGAADQELVDQHERVLFKLSQRHNHTMQRLFDTLADYLPADVEALVEQLNECGDCQSCMDVCPICSIARPIRAEDGHYTRLDVMRWLVSCSACGMCEQVCPNHLPLSATFGYIREQLIQEFGYAPGRSVDDPLPPL
ncbi:MAG: 4Fe-4S dicluster domain-containing protein [Chloroflexota bacterium]|nr:4Fe-4S dicluster domain-containing protein [Chloroflexota bacterium]